MSIHNFGKIEGGRLRKLKKRITGLIIAFIIIIAAAAAIGILTSNGEEYQQRATLLEENHSLREQIQDLQAQVTDLQGQLDEKDSYIASIPTEAPTPELPDDATAGQPMDEIPTEDVQSPRDELR